VDYKILLFIISQRGRFADSAPSMSLFGLINHLLNFLLPALVVGLLVAVLAPVVMKKARTHHSWLMQGAINSLACVLALVGGLWLFGHDGKMASYGAMVLACATCQWVTAKGWRG
jgi:uncharacterized BrkB/YihY/UPF0761 family membrane protein